MEKFEKFGSALKSLDLNQVANEKIVVCLAFLGLVSAVNFVWSPLSASFLHLMKKARKPPSLKTKYGGEWAMVINPMDDLGPEVCLKLAKDGFNLIFMCKCGQSIQKLIDSLKASMPDIQTLYYNYDPTFLASLEQINELKNVFDSISQDVSIIVNNTNKDHFFLEVNNNYDQILQLVNQNITSQVFMTQFLIPKLVDRHVKTGLKGALITTQRHYWEQDVNPCMSLYAASKAFNWTYNFSMNQQYQESVDQYTVNSQNLQSFTRDQSDDGLQNLGEEPSKSVEFELSDYYPHSGTVPRVVGSGSNLWRRWWPRNK